MTIASTRRKSTSRRPRQEHAIGKTLRTVKPDSGKPKARRSSSPEDLETLNAIRAGEIDALVIQGGDSEELYALRTFVEIEKTQVALRKAGAERKRSHAQLQSLLEERERLFQDMHDGCIQSIYAVGLNLEACIALVEVSPRKASAMIADAAANLNLVIQELRSFIAGRRLQIAAGKDLRAEIDKAIQAAGNHGVAFTVHVDEPTMKGLTPEQAAHLLQIARESISNATRHANARVGRISLQRRQGLVCFEVSDDGCGFIAKNVKRGLGLHHINARARKLGGTARVSSAPNQGTRIVVKFGNSRNL
jgi:signal transduction histidine kinase